MTGCFPDYMAFAKDGPDSLAEGLVEIEDADKIRQIILVLFDQDTGFDQGENQLADVRGAFHAPVLENIARHWTETGEREVPHSFRQLPPRDVTRLRQIFDYVVEGGQDEHVRSLEVARMTLPKAVEHVVVQYDAAHAPNLPLRVPP